MQSSVTKAFRQQLRQLPASVQEQAAKAYALCREDPYHNSLQFKRLSQRQPIYSARVSSLEFGLTGSGNRDNRHENLTQQPEQLRTE